MCLDVGASTGGFTDVLLKRGAARVYALDVGRGQLADVLRRDPRVISMERTHAARLDPSSSDHVALPEPVSLAVIDVSFISLTRVLGGVKATLSGEGEIVALVKPQFEAAPADVPGGVVRDAAVRQAMVDKVVRACPLDRPGGAGHDGVATPRPEGQPRVPAPPGSRLMRRIGFAFNPTKPEALELRDRALKWCASPRHRRLVERVE